MDGWNLLILGVLFAGHCELMAAWINRLHAVPMGDGALTVSQRVHDILVIGFLPYMVLRYGIRSPGLLIGGSWSELPPFISAYLALCGLGVLSLLWTVLRRQFRTPEPITASHIHNLRETLGDDVAVPGWRAAITTLPGNEATRIEVNEKRLVLPDLPPEWDGLAIAHLSDVHFHQSVSLAYFQQVFLEIARMRADLVCFTGDLLDSPERADWIADTFGALSAPLGCWFILGNHDWLYGDKPAREKLTALGWQDLAGNSALLRDGGRTLWLAGDETPWMGKPFDPAGADEAGLRILLSHTPDHFPRARRAGINIVLAGHNHGGQIALPLIGPVYSPSRFGIKYAGGTYRRSRSLMHVSRGVSAKRPLRWNCPPEVTRLVVAAK